MLAKYNAAAEKAMYDTVQKMPIATAVVLLVLITLALWWLFKKR